jgi:energy-converting hydrogenase Eha subunit C
MERFTRPSKSSRPQSLRNDLFLGALIAIGLCGAVLGAGWLDRMTSFHVGSMFEAVAAVVALLVYWQLAENKLDEAGLRIAKDASAYCLRVVMAAAVATVVLWRVEVVRAAVLTHGFGIFFGVVALGQAAGYWRARRRLA